MVFKFQISIIIWVLKSQIKQQQQIYDSKKRSYSMNGSKSILIWRFLIKLWTLSLWYLVTPRYLVTGTNWQINSIRFISHEVTSPFNASWETSPLTDIYFLLVISSERGREGACPLVSIVLSAWAACDWHARAGMSSRYIWLNSSLVIPPRHGILTVTRQTNLVF